MCQFATIVISMDSIEGHDCPAGRPKLHPHDFFSWGYLKSKDFRLMPTTMPELIQRIQREVNNLKHLKS